MGKRMRTSLRFFSHLYDDFFDNHCPAHAASLAYTTLLSIVPFMLFTLYILSFFPQLLVAGEQAEQFILNNFVASSASVIADQLKIFETHMSELSWTNNISLGVISVLLIYNMVSAVNHVWHVKMRLSLALSFTLYFIFILLAPLLFGVLLITTSYLTSLPFLSSASYLPFLKTPLLLIFPLLIEWIVFSIFNWVLPSTTVRFRYACFAGFVTMILFELAKFGFVQYLHYFPTYRLLYGALATIPIFLVWIYVSWLVILLGVLICHLLQKKPYLSEKA